MMVLPQSKYISTHLEAKATLLNDLVHVFVIKNFLENPSIDWNDRFGKRMVEWSCVTD